LGHDPPTQYSIVDYLNFLTNNNSWFINQNDQNPPFYILPGAAAANDPTPGSFSEAIALFQTAVNQHGTYIMDLPVAEQSPTPSTGHSPRNINQQLLETQLDGNNFKFKHLINIVLNHPDVVDDYQFGRNKPTWIFWRAGPIGNFAYIYISPDQQFIVMDGGYLSSAVYGDLNTPPGLESDEATLSAVVNSNVGSNIFYVVLGQRNNFDDAYGTAAWPAVYESTSQWTGSTDDSTGATTSGTTDGTTGTTDGTTGATDGSNGATDGSSDPVVTATGAACSIVPKNFNLF